MVKSIIW